MTWFNPVTRKIFSKPPKVKKVVGDGYRVLGGVRFSSNDITTYDEEIVGRFSSFDFFGIRFIYRRWTERLRETDCPYIVFTNNTKIDPPFDGIECRCSGKFEISITPAYGGYLEND